MRGHALCRYQGMLLALVMSGGATVATGDSDEVNLRQPEPTLQYLGVAGFLVRWRGEAVMFDPFFSRPSFPELLWLKPDTELIAKHIPKANDVTMLLVGHGHYDHLLDVSTVVLNHAPNATVYGSASVIHTLRAVPELTKLVNAEDNMVPVPNTDPPPNGKPSTRWFTSTGGRLRAMALQSMHAENFFTPLMAGGYPSALTSLPKTLFGWKEGQTLAWLVDLMDEENKPAYRIHFQDTASQAPYGFPPDLGDGKGVDVQILPVASWDKVPPYPVGILNRNKPRLVVLAHWEGFVGGDAEAPTVQRFAGDQGDMLKAVRSVAPTAIVAKPLPFSDVAVPLVQRLK